MGKVLADTLQREHQRYTSTDVDAAAHDRIRRGDCSLLEWAGFYLPDLAYLAFGPVHEKLASHADDHRYAAMAPRGSAKSTLISAVNGLRLAALRRKRFIVIVSPESEAHLARILNQVVENDRLLIDYPHLRPQNLRELRRQRRRRRKETQAEFNTIGGVTFVAKQPGAQIRGMVRDGKRPDHVILDDIETRDSAANPDRTRKLIDWVRTDIAGLKGPGWASMSIHAIGTPLAHYTLIGTLVDEWNGDIIPAVAADGSYAWPAGLDQQTLDMARFGYWSYKDEDGREHILPHDVDEDQRPASAKFVYGIGERAFQQEYMMRPVEEGAADFQRSWFDGKKITREELRGLTLSRVVRMWDLAATEKHVKNVDPDYTASVKMGVDQFGRFIILHAWQERASPHKVESSMALALQMDGHRCRTLIPLDPGQAGKWQVDHLIRKFAGYDVRAVPQTGDKRQRWLPLSAQAEAGNVYYVEGDWNEMLIDHLCLLPFGAHDDLGECAGGAFNELAPEGSAWGAAEVTY